MNTHEKVDEIAARKGYEESEAELVKMAQEDIHHFILNCQARGFQTGIKTGFIGIFVSLFIYLLVR